MLQILYLLFTTLVLLPRSGLSVQPPLEIVNQWTYLTYDLPWDFPADQDFNIPENIVATGIGVDKDRIFVATPRLFSGVPATLSIVSREDFNESPALQAYPNWAFHAAGRKEYNCSDLGLVSVYRLRIDSCNRIWALDAGVSRSLEDFEVTCPPKILVFDGHTDQVVRRIDFPPEVIRGETLFTNIIIDETTVKPENHCDDVFVYISDTVEPAIIVYDSGSDLTWRLSHPSMYPDPNFAQSTIIGQKFTLMDGVVGLAFDEKANLVYFQPLATDRLFSITTDELRAGPLPFGKELPVKLVGKKSSQGIGLAISPLDQSIFFAPMTETAVAKWNPETNDQKVIAYDQEKLQFIADMRITDSEPNTIFILSSRFHRFYLKNLDLNDVNTRILLVNGITSTKREYYQNPTINFNQQSIYTQLPTLSNDNHHHYQYQLTTQRPPRIPYSSDSFFNGIKQPYQYHQVGLQNQPYYQQSYFQGSKNTVKPHNYHTKVNFNNDQNHLRFVKSISYNTSSVHH